MHLSNPIQFGSEHIDRKWLRVILTGVFLFAFNFNIFSQYVSYSQFWNEYQFTKPLKDKWLGEINLGYNTSNSADKSSAFSEFTQFSAKALIHNYIHPRWKLTGMLGYFNNYNIPEINQAKSIEWRIAPQATYFINKRNFTLSTRGGLDLRFLSYENDEKKDLYRYRQMLKYLQPLNSKIIMEGVWYSIVSDDVLFKLDSDPSKSAFDRNVLTLGIGYSITNDIQIEVAYINEFIVTKEINNALSVSLVVNNLMNKLRDRFVHKSAIEKDE